jgi:hypothetical protein
MTQHILRRFLSKRLQEASKNPGEHTDEESAIEIATERSPLQRKMTVERGEKDEFRTK